MLSVNPREKLWVNEDVGLEGEVQTAGVTTLKVRLLEIDVPSDVTEMAERPAWLPGVIVAVYVPLPTSVTEETVPKVDVTVTTFPVPSAREPLSRGVIVRLIGLPVDSTAVSLIVTVDWAIVGVPAAIVIAVAVAAGIIGLPETTTLFSSSRG